MTRREEGFREPPVLEFIAENRFLSNFWPAIVRLDGVVYPSVEHAYQAAKTNDRTLRDVIRQAQKPGQAKRLGKSVPIRTNCVASQPEREETK